MSDVRIKKYQPGQLIFSQGNEADCAYIVESGEVEILVMHNSEEQIISTLSSGELFGEMGVMDNSPRTTSARAKTEVTLLRIHRQQITERMLSADPIIKSLVETLLSRSRSMLPDVSNDLVLSNPVDSSAVTNVAMNKFRLESELREAIADGDIQTFFQPLMDLDKRRIVGCEALSRWNHPVRGMISPSEFIELAEETDLIIDVGLLVFDRAFQLLKQLKTDTFVSINVSGRQLDNDLFFENILGLMDQYSINPKQIKLELTETLVIDTRQAIDWIKKCRDYGFSICADDFGTGYSGLLQLTQLDFDILKIDQSFVNRMEENIKVREVLQGMVSMAKNLRMLLVAEGIETQAQLDYLRSLGVNYGQGFWIGKPMDVEKFIGYIG